MCAGAGRRSRFRRKVPESSGECWCRFRKQSGRFRRVPARAGVGRFRRIPGYAGAEGCGGFRRVQIIQINNTIVQKKWRPYNQI